MMANATDPARPARRLLRWRTAIVLALVVLVGAASVYVVGGYLAYEDLSAVHPHCGGRQFASQTPADFNVNDKSIPKPPDVARYRFTDFTDVAFQTRGGGLTIRGWYAPPRQTGGPIVLLVHGYNACRRDWSVLLPAGMLHKPALVSSCRTSATMATPTSTTAAGPAGPRSISTCSAPGTGSAPRASRRLASGSSACRLGRRRRRSPPARNRGSRRRGPTAAMRSSASPQPSTPNPRATRAGSSARRSPIGHLLGDTALGDARSG